MVVKELVEVGCRIPVEKFHVSRLNVRAGEAFGEVEEDQRLIAQLRRGRIIGPFKARPEACMHTCNLEPQFANTQEFAPAEYTVSLTYP